MDELRERIVDALSAELGVGRERTAHIVSMLDRHDALLHGRET